MKHPATRDLYSYWDGLRVERLAPERVSIDPAAIRHLLADTFILEVDDALAYPYRLAGTRLCALLGHETRGLSFLDPWAPADAAEMRRLLAGVTDEVAAAVAGVELRSNQGHRLECELILLPLRHRGRTHARILGCLAPMDMPAWVGVCPADRLTLRSVRILSPAACGPLAASPPILPMPGARQYGHLAVLDGGLA